MTPMLPPTCCTVPTCLTVLASYTRAACESAVRWVRALEQQTAATHVLALPCCPVARGISMGQFWRPGCTRSCTELAVASPAGASVWVAGLCLCCGCRVLALRMCCTYVCCACMGLVWASFQCAFASLLTGTSRTDCHKPACNKPACNEPAFNPASLLSLVSACVCVCARWPAAGMWTLCERSRVWACSRACIRALRAWA